MTARISLAAALLLAAGCARPAAGPTPAGGGLPPVPARAGALAIDVVYPGENQALGVRDSTFVFGSVGTGGATLTIDGAPVEVAANGAFLAFLPVPADGAYDLVASAGGQTATLTRAVRVPAPPSAAAPAAAGAAPAPAFEPRVAVAASAREDGTAIGTAVPGSGTPYHWFFPAGTRLPVAGIQGGQYRVPLTGELSVWVDTADVDLLPAGTAAPRGAVANVVADPEPEWVDVRLGTSQPLPFRVDAGERELTVTVYGAETRTNNLLYGATDPLIDLMEWEQPADDQYRLRIRLNEPVWGWHPFWNEAGQLVVRVRRMPALDAGQPLRGLFIGVDAGHPPGGAIGPTRYTEAEATLAIAQRLVRMLRDRGARVLEIRPDMTPLSTGARTQMAADSSVQLLVSVHLDAFGDGVNPFENHGTHVFYNHPPSLDFSRAVQRELLAELGLRDLGVSRRDLALVRPTWMPSILTESLFMMIPRNEAAVRTAEVQERIAAAHVRGIEAFLRQRAMERDAAN